MNYQFNSYVNRQEAESLKQMIFQRARQRAQSMTSDVQVDIMNVARESFVSNNNPFSQILNSQQEEALASEPVKQSEPKTTALHEYVEATEAKAEEVKTEEAKSQEIGFPQRTIAPQAVNQNYIIQEQTSARVIQSTMREAHSALTTKTSFMGALSFLNSQAAVSLLNSRTGHGVDVIA